MHSRQSGSSYIDLLIGLAVLTIVILGLASSIVSSSKLARDTREVDALKLGCRNAVEAMRNTPVEMLVYEFGPGSGKHHMWLTPDGAIVYKDPGNAVAEGAVRLFTQEGNIPASFGGMAGGFDLNANGTIEAAPITDFWVLPAEVTFTNNDPDAPLSVTVDVILGKEETL